MSTSARPRPGRPGVWRVVVVGASVAYIGVVTAARLMAPGDPDAGGVAAGPPRFVDQAISAGVEHAYDGEFTFFVGGGVAAFDCDSDALPDLYFAGGDRPAGMFRNATEVGGTLHFERMADPATDLASVTGAYPLDIDGDHHVDLAVLRLGEDVILRGVGDCRFERANETLDIDGGDGWTVGFSASWEAPSAALPTLAFGDYLMVDAERKSTGECADGRLVRPDTSGTGYGEPVALTPSWCTLSMLFSDWDRSGRRDLRVSNDRHYYRDGEEQLWRVEPGRAPRLYSRTEGWELLRIWGMGIASEDITGDTYPEVYLTSQADNKLQTLADGPSAPRYRDVALRRGVTAHRPFAGDEAMPSTAWHPAFEDVNNDGLVDLYVSKGNVEAQAEYAMEDPSNLLIGQADGTFVEGAEQAGIVDFAKARGAAIVDLDRDGLLDIVQVVRRDNVRIWRNMGAGDASTPVRTGGWIAIDLEQDGPNHDAIGAWVAVRTGERGREREVTVGGGHASGQLVPLHFGLGDATSAEVRVTWPHGEAGPWLPVEAGRIVRVVRGATSVQPLS